MRAYYVFLRDNVPYIGFGWLITFFSSFGQTFLISLYVPELISAFGLTNGEFGTMYALSTIAASGIMLRFGPCVDYKPVRQVTYFTVFGLAFSSFLLSMAYHPVLLVLALIGLRMTGQGMMSHISLTIISRYYDKDRGKALSLASLGYSIGEAVFPLVITTLIVTMGWRWAAAASGVMLLMVLLPLLFRINLEEFDQEENEPEQSNNRVRLLHYGYIFKNRLFTIIAPATFLLSFTSTGLFFYQLVIAKERGWPYEIYAVFFTAYAFTRLCFSLLGGNWIDRFTAKRLFIFHLLPLFLSLLSLALVPGLAGAALFLLLMGIAVGLNNPIMSALIAELFGIERIGAVRSLFTMVMVISSALGPMLIGNAMDFGFEITSIALSIAALAMLVILNGFRLSRK